MEVMSLVERLKKGKFDTISVDIDGTLTKEVFGLEETDFETWEELYKNRTPRKDVIKLINILFKFGTITIYTSRYEEDRKVTEEWLNFHNVKYDKLLLDKLRTDVYIGDDAMNVEELLKIITMKL